LQGEKKILYDPGVIKNEDVARTLKRLRGSRTQAQCAKEGGLSPNAWTHYEKGRRLPGDKLSAQLAKGLGITLAKLEEEFLVSRNERMQEEKAHDAEAASRPTDTDDPYQRAVREGLDTVHRELEKILLLANPNRRK
jgi:transcriptional regulator with XRE-family HTH domain